MMVRRCGGCGLAALVVGLLAGVFGAEGTHSKEHGHDHGTCEFSIRSVKDGKWSEAATWKPARVPGKGDRVLIARGTRVEYDAKSKDVVRLVQVVGTLAFSRDRDTELNVGLLTVQHSDECSEHGFACEFEGAREGPATADRDWPSLLVGTAEQPIPADHTARIRLHYLEGMNKDDAPAIACCSGRMDLHGSPLSRSWVKLGADAKPGDASITLAEDVTGWRVGDEVIVTASTRAEGYGTFRDNREPQTEQRTIAKIEGRSLILDRPLGKGHSGSGEFRAEAANLSRNVIVETADPRGPRGHTVYHAFNRGMDDASAQNGVFSVDGLRIDDLTGGNQGHPVVHMSDNNLTGKAEAHFRNVVWNGKGQRPVFNRGGTIRVDPIVDRGVPYFVHDWFGPGRHAKIVSTKAADLLKDGHTYRPEPPLTGDESVLAEVSDVPWPSVLDPVDDVPPATIVTQLRREGDQLVVRGVSHDNGDVTSVLVNGVAAKIVSSAAGVVDWEAAIASPADAKVTAFAEDKAGNREQTAHRLVYRP